MPIRLRPARAEDLPGCAEIINDYIDATEWLPRSKSAEEIAAMFTPEMLDSRCLMVVDDGSRVLGYASYDRAARFLPALYLRPEVRGNGLGKLLLDAVKAEALLGFDLTVWCANPAARRFYGREGLVLTGEGTDADGLPVWHMHWAAP
ncbi:MAG: GNAT family N-acetyltransferase [Paracoccus sp. (in: a-proteobacteria)]|uniref:GNAT family N-acetyltransferase n=1 Tax=Paracoccus sp. TaxID=267 RepID=UPI0026E0D728|nr:GNAT family N-acetyltransferase [Paracoccus sp. (in: a-proteobacteria)]MDO5630363.1 GNAT family N-acetyltransferase [Paracoccus sp. (in: a-proteobacteria)]